MDPIIEHRVPVQIVIVEDEVMVRTGLRLLIESQPHLKVVGEVGDFESATETLARIQPDIVLLDLFLNGVYVLPLLPELIAIAPCIIVLTADSNPDTYTQALEFGAKKVVIKGEDPHVLLSAIEQLVDSEHINNFDEETQRKRKTGPDALTEKELKIIQLIGLGNRDEETASQLGIQVSTLRTQLSQIYHKVGVSSRLGLIVYAYQHRLASPPQ